MTIETDTLSEEQRAEVERQHALIMRGTLFGDEQTRATMERELRERLGQSLRDERPLRVYLGVDPDDVGAAITAVLNEVARLRGGPSPSPSPAPELRGVVLGRRLGRLSLARNRPLLARDLDLRASLASAEAAGASAAAPCAGG